MCCNTAKTIKRAEKNGRWAQFASFGLVFITASGTGCGALVLLCKAPQVMGGLPFHPLFQLLSLQGWGR